MHVFWIIFLFALGACVGSFLNVISHRLPRGQSIVFPGSHCPQCGRPIRWYDNIPLVSYVALRGRCRQCKAPISPRYLLIEAATAVILAGLYACYYVLDIRSSSGAFAESWAMYIAHAALLCGLLACSAVDVEYWLVPVEVCWVVAGVGLVSSAAAPHPWVPTVSPASGAAAVGAVAGLGVALLLQHYGILRQSFIDAEEPPPGPDAADGKTQAAATTAESGVSPRKEVLRELLFLAPAIVLAVAGWQAVTHIEAFGDVWRRAVSPAAGGAAAPHVSALLSSLVGLLVGGAWIWGTRIGGTLAFGREAMGLGDVHIMAAVGAVTGWVVPSVAFFVAPFFGLVWALYLFVRRRQRELPYGPWLAAGTVTVLVFYDGFARLLGVPLASMGLILQRGGNP
jgi:leader peptidase (prepilin peptidase)/N-methyltransferase